MKLAEYVAHDGLGLADLVRRREVSAGELAGCARRMIEAVNPGINAVVETYPEALAGSDDPAAPFHGVPFAIKDLVLHAAGQRMEMASRLMQGMVFPHDTDLMARFRRAGLRTVGRTNSPEFGYCPTTEPVLHGPTRNPWNAALTPGGSSGGSGAAVAAGIVPLAHASDGGGSIRIPAAYNGLVGLKPTRGRTPIGPDAAEGLNGLGIEFAVTRSVRDSATLLDLVQGPGLGDPYVAPAPGTSYVDAMRRRPAALRIALMRTPWNGVAPDPEVAQALETTARDCEACGHTVVEAGPALDWDEFLTHTMSYWTANLAAGIAQIAAGLGRPIDTSMLEATTLACYHHGAALKATDLLRAMEVANRITRTFAGFFQQYDVLLTPTLPTPPVPLGTLDANDASLDAESWTHKVFAFTPFTPVFNLTGQPAISLPLARTRAGLPIGMQFVGRYGAEDTLLGLAAQFESSRPWPQVAPLALAAAGD